MANVLSQSISLHWTSVRSAIGECVLIASEDGICWAGTPATPLETGLAWVQQKVCSDYHIDGAMNAPLKHAADEMRGYLAGEPVAFTCPLDLRGTPFQLAVWQALCTIPYGETCSYGEIAHRIGKPSAARAVGAANGANPVAIIVPCHRVIGGNGTLTGYGGGLPAKAWLLHLEGVRQWREG